MYSSSNSFLGGTNSARPGQPFAQQPSYSQFPPSQQQSHLQPGLPSQPTGYPSQLPGFGGPNLQAQSTGFPVGQLQPQLTGFPGAAPQQPPPPHQPSFQPPFQQPQITGYPSQTQAPQLQLPASTGLLPRPGPKTSSEIADSFQDDRTGAPQPPPKSSGSKIPNIRLSFITSQDQAKFEQLFKSAVGDSQTMDGEKAKELLLRSKLPGSDLSKIWILSDSTKSGRLFFPEFALAMYLCNLKITGRDLPTVLPERISNEVSSMVDIISFQVPDTQPEPATRTNVPNFDAPILENKLAPPAPQQPQPQQPTNSQLLSQLTAQQTGFLSQPTGFQPQQTQMAAPNQNLGPQPTGFSAQQPLQPQPTGFMTNPQPTGYSGPRPPLPPMPTGFGSNLSPAQTGGMPGLAAQPTGLPGQWGFVNAPATGLPNIEALKQQLMPQPGREGGFSTAGLSGNATIPWAITKEEKRIYDDLFRAWDGFHKGYIGGDTAIEIMGQSGLNRQDLERIWTLADPHNRGRLNMDEFAVAMHLIYRSLNGYPVPNRLPPELVPPSTRNLNDSIGTMKSLLSQDAETRKASGAFLQPQKTGVSYLKEHSFRGGSTSPGIGRKDATMFKNNDDAAGYRSSARRRVGNNGRTPSPTTSSSQASEDELSVEQLNKKIRETKVMLDAVDFQDESRAEEDDSLDRRDRKEAENLMDRIRRVQDDIDTHPNASFRHLNSGPERRSLRRQLQAYQDQVPQVASDVRRIEREIAEARLELFRLKDAKAHPDSASDIVGTGPGGIVTEADRIKARARARMQARAAELAGKPVPASLDDDGAAARRLEAESANVKADRERNDSMTRDVEDSVREFATSLEDGLRDEGESSAREHERRRWEDALGVEDVIRDFIYDLNRNSRTAHVRKDEALRSTTVQESHPQLDTHAPEIKNAARPSSPHSTTSPSSSTRNTHEDRVAAARERAQKRIAERMAAAGLRPQSDSAETLVQRQEREKQDREERLRKAEEEDTKREQERQRRLAEEKRGPSAPATKPTGKKPPPAPPSRKVRTDSTGQAESKRAEESAKAEHAIQEQAIKEEQQAQEEERKRLEDAARAQENEFQKEKEAQEARLRALEEQVKQGKLKKQEEKRRKEEAERLAQEKEASLAAQRAELEMAKERERQLQLELEGLDEESSSDEDGPTDITPQDSTPTQSQVLTAATVAPSSPQPAAAAAAAAPAPPAPPAPEAPPNPPAQPDVAAEPEEVTSPGVDSQSGSRAGPGGLSADIESNNPYFMKISPPADNNVSSQPSIPQTGVTSPKAEVSSTNPFHRLAQQEGSKPSFTASGPLERKSRARPEEDDWSAAGSEFDSSEDEDDDRPGGGSAKQLASILFGTMAPPRPLTPLEDKPASKSPTPVPESAAAPPAGSDTTGEPPEPSSAPPPPPPPPFPGAAAPSHEAPPPAPAPAPVAPPPPPPAAAPPPPAPQAAPGGGPPADRSALLGSIQAGRTLKKVQTNDRSTSSSAGRVLS